MRRPVRAAIVAFVALCVPLVPFVLIGELPGERWLSATDDNALRFAFAGAGLLAVDMILPIPSSILGTMLGARLGFGAGLVAAFAGMMVGQSAGYFVSRWLLRRRSDSLPAAPTLTAVFLSRPVPVLAEAVAIAAGAARVSWPQFLLACGGGNLVYAAVLALNGAQLVPDALVGPGIVLPMLLPIVGWLIWRAKGRPSQGRD